MASTKTTESTAKKTTAKKAAAKPAEKATKPAARKKSLKPAIITSDERYHMIEVAAYYIAEKNGFGHDHMHYWLQAEQEINAKLNA